jgi:hypothetical protein
MGHVVHIDFIQIGNKFILCFLFRIALAFMFAFLLFLSMFATLIFLILKNIFTTFRRPNSIFRFTSL